MSLAQEAAEFNRKLEEDRSNKASIARRIRATLGDEFANDIENIPWYWKVSEHSGRIRFTQTFPYDQSFEIGNQRMSAWDDALVAVDFDPQNETTILLLKLRDEIGDIDVRSGIVINHGKITFFDEVFASSDFRYEPYLHEASDLLFRTKGESGSMFDRNLRDRLEVLPTLVKESIGSSLGRFGQVFFELINSGEIDQKTMDPGPMRELLRELRASGMRI